MNRKELCALGITAKKRLVEINKPQNWLIQRVIEDTWQFLDNGYLGKIWTGERHPEKIIASICRILDIANPETGGNLQEKSTIAG